MRVILLSLLLVGCVDGGIYLTEAGQQEAQRRATKRGDVRLKTFNGCMELASKMPRLADDNVSDIVDSCDTSSNHLTVYLR